MQREYPILLNGENIGTAYILAQGLYYEVRCICKAQEGVLRIEADCGDRRERIGVCIPKDGKMVIGTRIPQKRLQGLVGFSVPQGMQKLWIPLKCGEPFPHVYKITDARFTYRNGVPGLVLPDTKDQDYSVTNTGK